MKIQIEYQGNVFLFDNIRDTATKIYLELFPAEDGFHLKSIDRFLDWKSEKQIVMDDLYAYRDYVVDRVATKRLTEDEANYVSPYIGIAIVSDSLEDFVLPTE